MLMSIFVTVLPKHTQPTVGYADENVLLPQWAIAVIVIGLASLLFVIIFGVTVVSYGYLASKKSVLNFEQFSACKSTKERQKTSTNRFN